ncbi:DNA polymerase III subunit beta [Paenibacillus sp. RC67]|uniref:DNA polymerase III subunit beta n=1 Tax=Paenibacillus sp. RC67 TaxID=3039392 RepID=UPI0024ACCE45|nr:DNA polymerase III subunit beta [Paenibacillus sp. RC67]
MYLYVSQELLLAALTYVSKAVNSNSPQPILSCVLIVAHSNGVTLRAMNSNMSIQYDIAAQSSSISVNREGSIAVPARIFHEIIHKLPTEKVTIESQERIMMIRSSFGIYRLCGMNPNEFPDSALVGDEDSSCLSLPSLVLKKGIRQAFAVSPSETRPILTGISFELRNQTLQLTATDGIRLATTEINVPSCRCKDSRFILPGKHALELAKMLPDDQTHTEIWIQSNQILFKSNQLQIVSCLLDGNYPPIRHLIPNTITSDITVRTSRLLQAVERVAILAGNHILKLCISSDQAMQIHSNTAEVGDVQEEVLLEERTGDAITLFLNTKYLLDVMRFIQCETVHIQFSGQLSPIVIQPSDIQSKSLYLVTPIRSHHY